jgi:hypothetical protein
VIELGNVVVVVIVVAVVAVAMTVYNYHKSEGILWFQSSYIHVKTVMIDFLFVVRAYLR